MQSSGKMQGGIERLLIVEDEPLIAFDNEYYLSSEGFSVIATTDSVSDALHWIEAEPDIDLLLLDIDLADGSGIDVARAARQIGIPVMFVTGNFPEEAADLATACLAKPYPKRTLLSAVHAVEAVLKGHQPSRVPEGLRIFSAIA